MSNSPLVSYTKISPNRTSPRNHKIDTITIHHVVGQLSVEAIGNVFAPTSRQASCNYGIGSDGRIGMYCEEKDRSWCSSSPENDHRAITIEVADDPTPPYAVNDKAYASLIKLLVDICKRNNIPKLLWKNDKALVGQVDKQNMTIHRWFSATGCPGEWLYERMGKIADDVNQQLTGVPSGWQQKGALWYWYEGGAMAKNKWVKDGGWWYYLGPSGAMLTGLQKISGKLYFLNPARAQNVPTGACIITDGSGAILGA